MNPTKMLSYREALKLRGDEEGLEKHELLVTLHRKRRVAKKQQKRLRRRFEYFREQGLL